MVESSNLGNTKSPCNVISGMWASPDVTKERWAMRNDFLRLMCVVYYGRDNVNVAVGNISMDSRFLNQKWAVWVDTHVTMNQVSRGLKETLPTHTLNLILEIPGFYLRGYSNNFARSKRRNTQLFVLENPGFWVGLASIPCFGWSAQIWNGGKMASVFPRSFYDPSRIRESFTQS